MTNSPNGLKSSAKSASVVTTVRFSCAKKRCDTQATAGTNKAEASRVNSK